MVLCSKLACSVDFDPVGKCNVYHGMISMVILNRTDIYGDIMQRIVYWGSWGTFHGCNHQGDVMATVSCVSIFRVLLICGWMSSY